jgi:hypothetical protein
MATGFFKPIEQEGITGILDEAFPKILLQPRHEALTENPVGCALCVAAPKAFGALTNPPRVRPSKPEKSDPIHIGYYAIIYVAARRQSALTPPARSCGALSSVLPTVALAKAGAPERRRMPLRQIRHLPSSIFHLPAVFPATRRLGKSDMLWFCGLNEAKRKAKRFV